MKNLVLEDKKGSVLLPEPFDIALFHHRKILNCQLIINNCQLTIILVPTNPNTPTTTSSFSDPTLSDWE
jgi:hypothetical protein